MNDIEELQRQINELRALAEKAYHIETHKNILGAAVTDADGSLASATTAINTIIDRLQAAGIIA